MLSFLRRSKPTSDVSPIFTIPDELISEIASHSREWSSPSGPVDATLVRLPSGLTNLSSTCRALRDIVTPVLYREVHITSAERLRSLAAASPERLGHIRVLSLHLDSDFFAEFAHSLDRDFRSPQHDSRVAQNKFYAHGRPLIEVLCSILLHTPLIQSFTIRLAKAASRFSAWKHFSFRSRGIGFSQMFVRSLRNILTDRRGEGKRDGVRRYESWRDICFPNLTHIHLDALEEISPLLKMAPNLTHLSLRMLEGYDSRSCQRLLRDIENSSLDKLQALALSPRSLHLPGTMESNVDGVELIAEIGQACPRIKTLDLRVHAYSAAELPYVSVYNRSSSSELISALYAFLNLRTLHLPGNLLDEEEMDLFLLLGMESDTQFTPERRAALQVVSQRETTSVIAMGEACPTLKNVSWVRRRDSDGKGTECSVEYSIDRWSPSSLRLSVTQGVEPTTPNHVHIRHVHLPPVVQEVPRKICSPISGPTFLGYSRDVNGLVDFRDEHPYLWRYILLILMFAFASMWFFHFRMCLHLITAAGILHMIFAKRFSSHVVLLLVANTLRIPFPGQFSKKIAKYSCVPGFV